MRHLVLGAFAALLFAPLSPCLANGNVLVIMADDMGIELVASYGVNPQPTRTPRIDALAANGVRFKNAWGYSRCSPTRATVLTGRFGFHTGIGGNINDGQFGWGIQPYEQTVPETLNATHATAYFGKWHIGNLSTGAELAPNVAGFEHFSGTLGLLRQDEEWWEWDKTVNGAVEHVVGYRTTDIVDDALEWIAGIGEPWYCVVGFNNPHPPLHVPPSHLTTYPHVPEANDKAKLYAMVEAMDTEIGRLLDSIDPAVMAETTVIFLGDNGTTAKGTVYEGGVHVPFIVAGAGVVGPGRVIQHVINTTDIHATVAELNGISTQAYDLDSISFRPHLLDLPASHPLMQRVRKFAFTERFNPNLNPAGTAVPQQTHRAVRNINYKLIRRSTPFVSPSGDGVPAPPLVPYGNGGPPFEELYNVRQDPDELIDLLAIPGGLSPTDMAQYLILSAELDAILAD